MCVCVCTHTFFKINQTVWVCIHTHTHRHRWFGSFLKKCMSTHTRTCKRKTYPLHWTLFLRRHWELIKNHFGKRDKLFVCEYKGLTIKIWGYNQYAYRRGGCLLLDLSKSSIELPFVIIVISHCLKKCYIIVIYRQDLLKISVQFFFYFI